MAVIYEWSWVGNMHVGVSLERVIVETPRGATEYVPDRPTCHMDIIYDDNIFDKCPAHFRPYVCDTCGQINVMQYKPTFCPDCGAEVVE